LDGRRRVGDARLVQQLRVADQADAGGGPRQSVLGAVHLGDAERGVGVAAAGVRLQVDELAGGGERGEPRDVDLYGTGQGAAADLQQHLVEEVVVRVGGSGDLRAGAGRVVVHHR